MPFDLDAFGEAVRKAVAGAFEPSPQPLSYRPPDQVDNRSLLADIKFDGPAGEMHPFQSTRKMVGLLVSVKLGALDIYAGTGFQANTLPRVPHLHFGQTNKPEWVPLPVGIHNFTAVSSGIGNNQACILVEGL